MEDRKIIELFFRRTEQAIWELDAKYGRACYKLAFNIVNNGQDADECVNDTYLAAWNAIPPAEPDPLFAYVCKIVRNISLKRYYRITAAKRNSVYDAAMQEIEDCLASAIDSVESQIEARELARIIQDYLDTLSKENRVIFMRRYAYADSYADIAKRVGLTEKNVSVRLARIRQKMRAYLVEREVLA